MSSLPETMKAVQIDKIGGTEVLQYKIDVPVPQLKTGEVLVKNEFVGKYRTVRQLCQKRLIRIPRTQLC
jgi:hypothetical protein